MNRISIAETTTEGNVCAIEFCSQGLMGEGWENILLPAGLLCGFCWSLNIFHSPYFRPLLGMSGNQTALYLYLICHGLRKKKKKKLLLKPHISPMTLCSSLGSDDMFPYQKTPINQINNRKRPPVSKFDAGTGILQCLFVLCICHSPTLVSVTKASIV